MCDSQVGIVFSPAPLVMRRNVSSPSQRRLPGGQRWVHTVGEGGGSTHAVDDDRGSRRGVLLLAGVPKVRDREGLLRVVRGYRILPAPLERLVAATLPSVEIALGVALIAGFAPRIAAAVATVLFTGFCVGLTVNLLRGRRELDCGCFAFGNEGEAPRIGWFHAVRAATLAVVAGRSRLRRRRPRNRRARAGGRGRACSAGRNRRGRATALGGPPRTPARRRAPEQGIHRIACRIGDLALLTDVPHDKDRQ